MIIFASLTLILIAGCGSLSLFSSRHVHYHGSEETDKRVDQLDKRIAEIEKTIQKQ